MNNKKFLTNINFLKKLKIEDGALRIISSHKSSVDCSMEIIFLQEKIDRIKYLAHWSPAPYISQL